MSKKIMLLTLFIIFYTITHAQYANWMMGTWKNRSGTITSSGSVNDSIRIDNVSRESFTGIRATEINDHTKITVSISGGFNARGMYLQDEQVLHKEGQWNDCSACAPVTKMIISRDSILLVNSIADCDEKCNTETFYYKLLSQYDSATQRYLVDRFGRPPDIIGFRPFRPKEGEPVAANMPSPEEIERKRLEETDDSIWNALQKKQQQQITNTTNLVQQNDQRRLKDSLDNVAKLEKTKHRTEDSLHNVQAKKRQREITDSINLAKQKEQQRIKDSLDSIARIRQQQTDDSMLLAQQKKREQEIADSLSLVQQREQQRIKDSLDNIARIRQQQTDDSTLLAQQKKREQEITDSLSLVQQKEQQRIKDSLDNIARIRQQQIDDSTLLAQQKKREQEIADSLNLVQQREQQRIKDSLQNVAEANLQQQRTEDSLNEVQARKRQQEIADSLASVRKQQYKDSLQKAALAKAVPSIADKALTSRASVLLKTYHITSPDILIELFDNGEIDSDRVSVYHNNAIVVSNQVLGIKPITLNIHADATNREHEFVLVAENLGSIPPNSALMRITAGKQVYKLTVNTDMKTNARIVFYYDGN